MTEFYEKIISNVFSKSSWNKKTLKIDSGTLKYAEKIKEPVLKILFFKISFVLYS